jgi:dephospho-CoA kinase
MTPPVLGLTGGIACGKSTAAGLLRARGWMVVDSDEIAHRLMLPGGENWQKIVDSFGPTVLHSDQTINRAILGNLVFQDVRLREKLNSLTHPAIRKVWQKERDGFLNNPPANAPGTLPQGMVVVIPLLFEAGLESEFADVACVACSPERQRERLRQRGLDVGQIASRLASQWPLEEKAKRSRWHLWNEGSLASLERQIDCLDAVSHPLTKSNPLNRTTL